MSEQLDMPAGATSTPKKTDSPAAVEPSQVPQQRPTEHVADVVRAVSSDTATFKHADDDTIATSISKVCTSGALFGIRPGPMIWAKVARGTGTHPESVSREEFVNAVDDFCASER
jgi:hypothetical protein